MTAGSFDPKLYPIAGVHAAPADGDVDALASRVTRLQSEIGDLAAEALRVRDQHRAQFDALAAEVVRLRTERDEAIADRARITNRPKWWGAALSEGRQEHVAVLRSCLDELGCEPHPNSQVERARIAIAGRNSKHEDAVGAKGKIDRALAKANEHALKHRATYGLCDLCDVAMILAADVDEQGNRR